MHDHGEILALTAAAIDFELDGDERQRLADALETCTLCRRQIAAMRATGTVLRRPLDIGTPGRVRDVVIGAALDRRGSAPGLRSLLAASLSILVVVGGAALFIGTRGLGILPVASPVASSPAQNGLAQSSVPPSASKTPDAAPSTRSTATPAPSPGPADLRPGDLAAMVTDGRLVIRTLPETGANSAIFKTRLYPGQRVLVIEGPVEADGYPWYRVRLGIIEGWVAAADRDGTAWLSPVGNGTIAFVREAADGTGEAIHTIDADGRTGEAVLFDDPTLAGYRGLTWSPDGRRLAFVSRHSDVIDDPSDIFAIDADGSNLVQLTDDDRFDDSPVWSPDGTQLAFRRSPEDPLYGTFVDSEVVVLRVDGSDPVVLGPGENPAWAPDGQLVAMTVTDGDVSHAWVQEPDGAGRRQIGDVAVARVAPAWSPDGQVLLVSADGFSLVDVASGSVTPLTTEARSSSAPPAWSIGGPIVFEATESEGPGVFVIEPDGSRGRQVLVDRGPEAVASWSPDGRLLLLADEHTGSPVTIVDPGNGVVIEVDATGGFTRSAAWQPLVP